MFLYTRIHQMNSQLDYLLYRGRFRLREYLPFGRFPVHVDIELAAKCQLACTMCPYGTGAFNEDLQGMMEPEMARMALHQARQGGALSCKLNFRGEPGLAPRLDEMVRVAKQMGFVEIAINTNLTAFSLRRLHQLAAVGLDLMIVSVDGATKDTYEAIRVNGDFAKLMSNLEFIRAMPKRPKVRLQMVVQDNNRHEKDEMERVFGHLCDELVFQEVRDRGAGEGTDGQRKRCPQPWQRLIVAWDGTVFGCCGNWANEFPLGNIKHESLQEIWHGDRMRELRDMAAKPEQGFPCRDCTVGASYK